MCFIKNKLFPKTKVKKEKDVYITKCLEEVDKVFMEHKLDYFKNLYLKHGINLSRFNAFGIRNEDNQNKDIWNDIIGYFIEDDIHFYKATTDPGRYYTLNPINTEGTAHLCLGYQENIWKIDKHQGKYTAFCNKWNCEKTKIWRDRNQDYKFDNKNEKVYSGHFGINLHRSHRDKLIGTVGKYSAGCQVIRNPNSYKTFIEQAIKSEMKKFSYFLFDYKQIEIFNELM